MAVGKDATLATSDKLISGREIAARLDERTRHSVEALVKRGVTPLLAIAYRGEHADAASYRKVITQRASRVGITCRPVALPADADLRQIHDALDRLGADPAVHGVLVQTPLPREMRGLVVDALPERLDVEGITAACLGRVMLGAARVLPCTAAAIVAIIDSLVSDVRGKQVVIVNNSTTVGRPLAQLLLQRRATVTVCNTGTVDLAAETRRAEILVTAIGRARFFGAAHISPGALVVDVGINPDPTGSGICGDVDTPAVLDRVSGITPVPGGVGPVTTAMLLANLAVLASHVANTAEVPPPQP